MNANVIALSPKLSISWTALWLGYDMAWLLLRGKKHLRRHRDVRSYEQKWAKLVFHRPDPFLYLIIVAASWGSLCVFD